MNETPRLRSAWPSTPKSDSKQKHGDQHESRKAWAAVAPMPAKKTETAPAIPSSLLDAPSQRFYVSLLYLVAHLWRFYDYSMLSLDGTDNFWLFTKWVGIDTAFLYGLSGLNIPWLQWSSSTFTILFIGHAAINWLLMFQVSVPLFAWMSALTKLMYDREYVISERYVKPSSVTRNSSVILGKQIVHVLPEGSVMLNPEQLSYCVDVSKASIDLHIGVNQTNPIFVELLRVDLDTNEQETIGISAKELKKMQRAADRDAGSQDRSRHQVLRYPIKQAGLYRLQSVIDESKLEVRRRSSDALVVQCPTASIQAVPHDKCKGDLSDFYLQVDATLPFKVKYSKFINRDDHGHTVLSIPSENSKSPLVGRNPTEALAADLPLDDIDVSWARTQTTRIPLNESLGIAGAWQYSIDEVRDGCGNTANYSFFKISESAQKRSTKPGHLEQHFLVHEKPKVALQGCDSQKPIKVGIGDSRLLPLHFFSFGEIANQDAYTLKYLFTPQDEILPDQNHPTSVRIRETVIRDYGHGKKGLMIREPGLYSIYSINSAYCEGDILEPSSCQLMNSLEPDLSIATTEQIPDKCAGNSIGLQVDLDLVGTPPFKVYYTVKLPSGKILPKVTDIDRFHSQLELRPHYAGHYTYIFDRISDAVYTERSLAHKGLILDQDLEPLAFAHFLDAESVRKVCFEETVSYYVSLSGKSPYTLEYELLHHGRRQKRTIGNIQDTVFELKTEPLIDGGDYYLTLTSIIDATTCRRSINEEAHFSVGLQRPRASFGFLEGKRNISALESKRITLPLRLQGEAPWMIGYRRGGDPTGRIIEKELRKGNDQLEVSEEGLFELISVRDNLCPGSVDTAANKFFIQWIARPQFKVIDSPLIQIDGDKRVRKAVCEGDEDATELYFTGTAPFNVEYDQRHRPERGSQSTTTRKFTAGLHSASIQMDTSESGLYVYQFSKLGDASYNHDPKKLSPIEVEQRVHPRPSASFVNIGKNYKYCDDEQSGGEIVPITLTGTPPFHLELEVRHLTTTKPEHISIPNIESNRYDMHLPRRVLELGSHSVTIRKIRDSWGCQRAMDYNAPYVQVTVADIPTISPLEGQSDFCVGDRISYALSGTPPFNVFYTFQGQERKAKVSGTEFRRLAEQPGIFAITALSDARSTDSCKAKIESIKTVHEMPSVRVSKGGISTVDIHEGGRAEILFEFGGTPPFHFTYTRSTTPAKGRKATVLETKNGISQGYSMTISASDEGTYEVVSIRDKFCAYSSEQAQGQVAQKALKDR